MALLSAGLSIPTLSCRPKPKATTRGNSKDLGVLPFEPELKTALEQIEKEEKEKNELEGPDGSFLYGAPYEVRDEPVMAPDLKVVPEAEELD